MQLRFFALAGLAILLSSPGMAVGQTVGANQATPSNNTGQGFDPDQMFNRFTNGKNIWVRAEITDPRQLRLFDRLAQQLGITRGEITRGQFTTAMQQFRTRRQQSSPGSQPPAPTSGGSEQTESFDQMAERQFKQRDRNGDGYLNSDEVSGSMRAQFSRWDKNGDGLIDLNEFKAYLQARSAQRQVLSRQYAYIFTPPPEEDRKQVVYSPSNYPKELPAWFKQLDVDGDGQVALYEWRQAGKSLAEFQALDRNGDGFLTVEEVLYDQALVKKEGKKADPRLVADLDPGKGVLQRDRTTRLQLAGGTQPSAGAPGSPGGGPSQRGQRFRDRSSLSAK